MAKKKIRKPASKKSGGSGMNPQNLLAQVQKLQAEMMAAQEALKEELVGIEIAPEVVDPEDVEMLQDLLVAAFNEALNKARAVAEERMAPFASMLDMGGLGGLLG